MSTLINPHIALLIKGIEDWDSDEEPVRLDMSITVEKDLDGEPNEAEVIIHNLNADTRNRIIDPAVRDMPIEIFYAPFGSDERVSCFVGEIERKRNEQLRPGMATHLFCKSQRWQSRDKYIDSTTFEAGTPVGEIIDVLTGIIDLPVHTEAFNQAAFLSSQTLSGPAFLQLRRFIEPYGLFAFICDGALHITDVYEIPNPTVVEITNAMLTGPVEPTERNDAVDVMLRSIAESTILDAFEKPTKTRKKKRKKVDLLDRKIAAGPSGYIEYEAVDDTIFGVSAELLGVPALIPDNVIQFEDDPQYYRVQTVTHSGDTREGVLTTITADVYEEEVTAGGAF